MLLYSWLAWGFTKEIYFFSVAKELNTNNNFSFITVCARSSHTSYPIQCICQLCCMKEQAVDQDACLNKKGFFFCSVVFCCLYEITLTLTYNSWNEVIIVMFTCFCRKTNINFFSWCLNVFLKNENATEEFQCHHEQCQCTNERFYKTQDCFAWTK